MDLFKDNKELKFGTCKSREQRKEKGELREAVVNKDSIGGNWGFKM